MRLFIIYLFYFFNFYTNSVPKSLNIKTDGDGGSKENTDRVVVIDFADTNSFRLKKNKKKNTATPGKVIEETIDEYKKKRSFYGSRLVRTLGAASNRVTLTHNDCGR